MQLALGERRLGEGQVVVERRLEGGGRLEEKGQHYLFVILVIILEDPLNFTRK